jgi:hypothetical protein
MACYILESVETSVDHLSLASCRTVDPGRPRRGLDGRLGASDWTYPWYILNVRSIPTRRFQVGLRRGFTLGSGSEKKIQIKFT